MTQVFSTMLTLSIKAGWLVLAILVVRLLLKKAPKSITCLLWLLVAIRLVCPFEVTSPFSAFQFLMVTGSDTVSGETGIQEAADGSYTRESVKYKKGSETTTSDAATAAEQTTSVSSSAATNTANGNNTWTVADVDWKPIEAGVWAGGTAVLLLLMLVHIVQLRKKLQIAIPLETGVYVCEEITDPFVFGCLHPAIYLPSGLDEQTRKSVLAHEKAHIRRKDALWKNIGYVLLCFYWWNPLLWVAYALFCRDLEMACDEQVIRDMQAEERKSYAQALLDVSSKRRSVLVYPLGFGEVGVKGRIKAVLGYKKAPVWIGAIAVVLCLAVAVIFLTAPKTDEDFRQVYPQGTDSAKVLIGGETDPFYSLQVPGNYIWAGTFNRYGETRDIDEEQTLINEPLSDGTEISSYIWNTFRLSSETDMDFGLDGMFVDYTAEEIQDNYPGSVSVGTKALPAIAQMVYVDTDTVETEDKLPMANGQTIADGQKVTDGRVLQLNLLVELPKEATWENTIHLLLEYRSPSLTTDTKKWGKYLYHMLSACSDTEKEAVLNANDQLAAAVPKTASLDIKQNYRVSRYTEEERRNKFEATTASYDLKKNVAAIIDGKPLTKAAPESLDGQLRYSIENHRMTLMFYPDANWVGYTSDYYKGGFYLTDDEMKQLTEACGAEIDAGLVAGDTEWSESDWSETTTPVTQEN